MHPLRKPIADVFVLARIGAQVGAQDEDGRPTSGPILNDLNDLEQRLFNVLENRVTIEPDLSRPEIPIIVARAKMRCSRCGVVGHTKRSHKKHE